jgi:hypothetical protein
MGSFTFTPTDQRIQMGDIDLQTMVFLFNAINDGWAVRKRHGRYIFTKKHKNHREASSNGYLDSFIGKHITYRPTSDTIGS